MPRDRDRSRSKVSECHCIGEGADLPGTSGTLAVVYPSVNEFGRIPGSRHLSEATEVLLTIDSNEEENLVGSLLSCVPYSGDALRNLLQCGPLARLERLEEVQNLIRLQVYHTRLNDVSGETSSLTLEITYSGCQTEILRVEVADNLLGALKRLRHVNACHGHALEVMAIRVLLKHLGWLIGA